MKRTEEQLRKLREYQHRRTLNFNLQGLNAKGEPKKVRGRPVGRADKRSIEMDEKALEWLRERGFR